LHQPLAGAEGLAAVKKDRRARRVLPQGIGGDVEHFNIAVIEHEAVLGQGHGGRDQRGAGQGAVFFARHFQAGDGAGHGDGVMAAGARSMNDLALRIQIHIAGGRQRRGFAEIKKGLAAVGELQGHEAAAAEIARRRIDHRQRIADGDRGIDRVATLFENRDADLAGQMLGSDHHAVLRRHRRSGGGAGDETQTAEQKQDDRLARLADTGKRHVGIRYVQSRRSPLTFCSSVAPISSIDLAVESSQGMPSRRISFCACSISQRQLFSEA
jgi:hypothetical protein